MKYCFVRWPEGKLKAVTMSYDDASRQDIPLAQLMNRYGIKGTFNIIGVSVDRHLNGNLTLDEMRELYFPLGHDVAVHGYDHKAQTIVSPKDGIEDVLECRRALENAFGRIITGYAYPDRGQTSEQIKSYLRLLGIKWARTVNRTGRFSIPTDWLEWCATCKHDDPLMLKYAEDFLAAEPEKNYIAYHDSLLYFVWGHSFELSDELWKRVEELYALIGGRDDIWYATNNEIFEYVEAFNSLVFSLDNRLVYNPTLKKLWFEADGRLRSIEPGETLTL